MPIRKLAARDFATQLTISVQLMRSKRGWKMQGKEGAAVVYESFVTIRAIKYRSKKQGVTEQ